MGAIPAIGLLLALAAVKVLRARSRQSAAWAAIFAAALVPLFPVPRVEERQRPPLVEFISAGTYREWVRPGGTMVTVPLPDAGNGDPMRWQVATNFEFKLPGGYFIGPQEDGRGWYGPQYKRETAELLKDARSGKKIREITDTDRAQARADLEYWQADAVVLQDGQAGSKALRALVDELLGFEGTRVGEVTVWNVQGVS
jgi:dolichyl-phosphate beta-glucosyltransferase